MLLSLLVSGAWATHQDPLLPENGESWRSIPTLPRVWLVDSLKYVMFNSQDNDYVITVRGQIDNNEGGSITVDNIDRVARGFFFQDASFGFNSLDGFVVFYIQETEKWYSKSLLL